MSAGDNYSEHRRDQMDAARRDFAQHWDRWVQSYVTLRGYISSDERTINAVKHVAWQAFMAGISTHEPPPSPPPKEECSG